MRAGFVEFAIAMGVEDEFAGGSIGDFHRVDVEVFWEFSGGLVQQQVDQWVGGFADDRLHWWNMRRNADGG